MDWFKFCKDSFDNKVADTESLKIYVQTNKITAEQYKQITNIDYV